MILRLWRGKVASDVAAEYCAYQLEVGPSGYRAVKGCERVLVLGRDLGAQPRDLRRFGL